MTTEIITQLGWHKEGFFAWSNGIYSDGAFQPITEDDICIHNGKKYHIKITEPTSFEVMRYKMKFRHTPGSITLDHWLDLFTKVYKDNAIVGFSYYVATLFRDLIVADTGYYFPILYGYDISPLQQVRYSRILRNIILDLMCRRIVMMRAAFDIPLTRAIGLVLDANLMEPDELKPATLRKIYQRKYMELEHEAEEFFRECVTDFGFNDKTFEKKSLVNLSQPQKTPLNLWRI